MSTGRITVLGRLGIDRAGSESVSGSALGGRRGELVLAYLAVEHRRAVTRDELANALWPEALPDSWSAALRGVVSDVRRFLRDGGLDPDELLATERGRYRLRLGAGMTVDVDEARASLVEARGAALRGDSRAAGAAAERAASLAALPFLPEHDGEWVEGIRDELAGIRVEALELLIGSLGAAGDLRAAVRAAERLVEVEPYSDAAHRLRIETLAAAGDRAGALRAYDECRRLLRDELGLDPSAETRAVVDAILAAASPESPPSTPRDADRARPHAAATGFLVEREHDLAIVEAALAGIPRGRFGLVVIEGPAGIGKTRLLAEGRRLAVEVGARVLAARASELEGEFAFGVVRQLFEGVFDAQGLGLSESAAAAAREMLEAPPPLADGTESVDASFAMLDSLYWLALTLAAEGPLVIAVDDLHWCDEPSLRFLNYLVRRLEGLRVTVLCTVRPRERRARAALVTEIVGDPLAKLVRPGPLSKAATARLISEGLGESADETFSTACHTATGGNPLLLRELISTMQIEGVTPDAGHISAVSDLGPRAVSRAVLVRLGRLTEDALRLARAASVVRAGANLPFLAALAGLEPDDAAAAADALVAAEILTDEAGAAFVHPLVGVAVYEDIPAHDRALAHERAAHHLRDHGKSAGAVAVHLALAPARGREWVCDVLQEAARESLRAGSPASAVHYLARALSEPPPPERRPRLLLELGTAEAMLHTPSAIEHLTEAFEQGGDTAVRGSAALTLARTLLFYPRPDASIALIHRARAEIEPGSDVLLGLQALELMAAAYGAGRPVSPERLERPLAPGAGAGAKMLAAVISRQLAYAGGSADECVRLALDALEDGKLMAADIAFLSVTAILTLVRADRPEAEEHWEELRRESRVRGSLAAKAGSSLWRGYAHVRRGELDEAEESLKNALEEFRLLGSSEEPRVHHAAFLSAVLRERGDLDGARRALEAVRAPRDASDTARYWLDGLVELLLAEERFDEAYGAATDMERRFAFIANPIDTPVRLHRAVAAYHLGRREEGLALARESVELARRWGASGGLARALRVLGTLEREDGLGHLHEAVDAAEGSVARLEHAKALVALGTSLRLSRRPTDAREPLRRGLDLAAGLGAEALVAHARHELRAAGARGRTAALTGPAALTPAERRVAERAAAGQTNRAIAEALFVTTKTVELHLRNVYRKLGVRSRGELRGKLDPAPYARKSWGAGLGVT